jgi:hypothetical protein
MEEQVAARISEEQRRAVMGLIDWSRWQYIALPLGDQKTPRLSCDKTNLAVSMSHIARIQQAAK